MHAHPDLSGLRFSGLAFIACSMAYTAGGGCATFQKGGYKCRKLIGSSIMARAVGASDNLDARFAVGAEIPRADGPMP